jgi:hypothetical protein
MDAKGFVAMQIGARKVESYTAVHSWESLSLAEQTLLRRALSEYPLAGSIQDYGMALRWSGAENAPAPRSYTAEEQRQLVPQLAEVALNLARRGAITVHQAGTAVARSDVFAAGTELEDTLGDPENWIWKTGSDRTIGLSAPDAVRAQWITAAYPTADTSSLPAWDELSLAEQKILVCASEASGMLTGPFGIWEDLPTGLDERARLAWVERQIAPLLPFVREGWIEVHHCSDGESGSFDVISSDRLGSALADPDVRYDEGDEWGIGVSCIFTHCGLAVWHGGWSHAWGSRLRFD